MLHFEQVRRNRFHPIPLYVPFLLASSGLRSKMSTPCIFPRISRRSRPVACSMSVGMVPGAAPPEGRRSCSLVISAVGVVLAGETLSRRSSQCPRLTILQNMCSDIAAVMLVKSGSNAYPRKASCAWSARRAWGRCESSQLFYVSLTPSINTATPQSSSPDAIFRFPASFPPQWPQSLAPPTR